MDKVVVSVQETVETLYSAKPLKRNRGEVILRFAPAVFMIFIALYGIYILDDYVVAVAAIIYCLLKIFAGVNIKKVRKVSATETRAHSALKKYTITAEGVLIETDFSRTEYKWSDLYGCKVDDRFLFIYYNSFLAYGIPKEKLSEEEISFIMECAEAS